MIFCALNTAAQIPYQTLDSLTMRIRKLQLAANDLNYNAGNGKSYKISFSEDNFGVLSYNRLGYNSVYKTMEGEEIIRIVEDADLSAVTSLEMKVAGEVAVITLKFPSGSFKSTVLENGIVANGTDVDQIELFTKANNNSTTAAPQDMLFALIADLCNKMKEEKGYLSAGRSGQLAKKWASASATSYPTSLTAYSTFLKENSNTLYSLEANKRLQLANERKQKEDLRIREAATLREEVYTLAEKGDQSYRNYAYYFRADTTAAYLLRKYKPTEIGDENRSRLQNYRQELQERYKWNQEYYQKSAKIIAYDAMVQKTATLDAEYARKLEATVNGSLILKASLLALGGIAAGIGAYATIAKDDAFSPAFRNNLLMYGGGAFTICMTWTIIQGSSVKRAGNRAAIARKEAKEISQSIGPVLDKRNEKIGQKPLINTN